MTLDRGLEPHWAVVMSFTLTVLNNGSGKKEFARYAEMLKPDFNATPANPADWYLNATVVIFL